MGVISDLLQTLKKLRKVKYGDTVLSSDHNDLVDAVNKLLDLYLPSRIDPTQFVYEPYMIHNFIDSPCSIDYEICGFTIGELSKCIVSGRHGYLHLESTSDICLRDLNGVIALCMKFTKVQPLYVGEPDTPIMIVFVEDYNGSDAISTACYFEYTEYNGKIYDKIYVCDGYSENRSEYSPIPNDWIVFFVDLFAREAKVLDRNGKCLCSVSLTTTETQERYFVVGAGYIPEGVISPNKLEIDWIVY